MPEGAVYVGRPSKWGNPYRVQPMADGDGWRYRGNGTTAWSADDDHQWSKTEASARAVEAFRERLLPGSIKWRNIQVELAGRDLACWCPLDQPCHADVLLEIATGGRPVTPTERRRRNRLADVLWLAETGENLTGAATRLGIDPESLRSWCRRHAPDALRTLNAREPRDPNQRPGLEAMSGKRWAS
jgi:hypothetical protein